MQVFCDESCHLVQVKATGRGVKLMQLKLSRPLDTALAQLLQHLMRQLLQNGLLHGLSAHDAAQVVRCQTYFNTQLEQQVAHPKDQLTFWSELDPMRRKLR